MLAEGAMLDPGVADRLGALPSNAGHVAHAIGRGIQHLQGRLTKDRDDAAGEDGTDLPDQAGAEIADDPFGVGGLANLGVGRLELRAMTGVHVPLPGKREQLAGLDGGQGANDGHRLTPSSLPELQDGKARFRVIEGDPLDGTIERHRRGILHTVFLHSSGTLQIATVHCSRWYHHRSPRPQRAVEARGD